MISEWEKLNQRVMNIAVKNSLKNKTEGSIMATKKIKAEVKKINSFHSWKAFCKKHELMPIWDISHRGGVLGVYKGMFMQKLLTKKTEDWMLPPKVGVYCNYLGGGLRGSVQGGGYNEAVPESDAELIDLWADACKRAYLSAEQMEDEDGEVIVPDDPINTGYGRADVVSAY